MGFDLGCLVGIAHENGVGELGVLCDKRSQGVAADVARCTSPVETLDLALLFSIITLNLTGRLSSFSGLSLNGVGKCCCERRALTSERLSERAVECSLRRNSEG